MTKKKVTEEQVLDLDKQIEDLDLPTDDNIANLSPERLEEVAVTIAGNSMEAFRLRRARKDVRYKLYRLRTEAEGKSSASDVSDDFRKHFENQPFFKGWKFFAALWDVSLLDPMQVVARDHSEIEEWEAIVRAKFPQLTPDGKVVYPDISVKEKVDLAAQKFNVE